MKIAVVGGRDFDNYELLRITLRNFLFEDISDDTYYENFYNTTIVSGGAKGADTLAENFAEEYICNKLIFKPDWELYGKQAGFLRNVQIIDNADIVFAFWDGKSKGTQHSINLAKSKNKELYIVRY